ncbi:MAG: hypothetical protein CL721_06090, partial [Chloroflexi bacterium]|nr:hypothetical protein [Chloroflexota bacterium]
QLLLGSVGWRTTLVVMAMVFMALSVPLSAIFLRRQPEDMGLTVDGVKPLPPNSNRSPGRNQLGEDAAWTVKQAFRTATMYKLLAFALAGVAQGGKRPPHPVLGREGDRCPDGFFSLRRRRRWSSNNGLVRRVVGRPEFLSVSSPLGPTWGWLPPSG